MKPPIEKIKKNLKDSNKKFRLLDFIKKHQLSEVSFYDVGVSVAETDITEIDLSCLTMEVEDFELFMHGLFSFPSNTKVKKIDLRLFSFSGKARFPTGPFEIEIISDFPTIEDFIDWVRYKKTLVISNGCLTGLLKLFSEKNSMFELARSLHETAVENIDFDKNEISCDQILNFFQGLEITLKNTNNVINIKVPNISYPLYRISEFHDAYRKTKLRSITNNFKPFPIPCFAIQGSDNQAKNILECERNIVDELASLMSNLHLLPNETKNEIMPGPRNPSNPKNTMPYPDSAVLKPTFLKTSEIRYACGLFLGVSDDIKGNIGKYLPMLDRVNIERFREYRTSHSEKIGRVNEFQSESSVNWFLTSAKHYWASAKESLKKNVNLKI